MSWSTDSIKNIMDAQGYVLIPENKTAEESSKAHKHKSYTLKWGGASNVELFIGNDIAFNNKVTMEILYTNIDQGVREENAQLFINLMKAMAKIESFLNFTGDQTFEDIDNKTTKGTLEFYYGVETNC